MKTGKSSKETPPQTIVDHPSYGGVWSAPVATLAEIFMSCSSADEALRQALSKGYFTQYTSFRKRDYIEAVTDWELDLLTPWLGSELKNLPASLDELPGVPNHLLIERNGRILSPDLLRNLWYAQFLCHGEAPRLPHTTRNVLEIGSGYGSLARCLKTLRPSTTFWLVDLPESLACAAAYLKQAFSGSKIIRLDDEHQALPCDGEADFVLVPANCADQLAGCHFDLAVNIWSLGEMPNAWIRRWFNLIQVQCQVDRIYLLNAFMAPVTSEYPDACLQGDWLLNLDESWQVSHFEIDPPIHRCPHVRNFYTGIEIFATRQQDIETLKNARLLAAKEVDKVLIEDWAQFVIAGDLADLARPESALDDGIYEIHGASTSYRGWTTRMLLSITEYIGLPHIEAGLENTLFRLWNDFRCNRNPNSAVLLAAHLAMTGKALPGQRCVKEIVFLLGRISEASIHNEYASLQSSFAAEIRALAVPATHFPLSGMTTTAPQTLPHDVALQQAIAHHQAGRLHEAELLYRAILQAQPSQPDANHNLGVLAWQMGQHAAGLPYLKAALAINPSQGQYALSYAEALLATGQAKEALNILKTARQRGFHTPAAKALRQQAEAAAMNSTAKEKAPSHLEMNQLAALFNAGHLVEVENRARSLIEQYPDSGFAWKALGTCLQVQGKDGLTALQRAVELMPNDAELHRNLGVALRDLGHLDGAVASYRRALEIKPDYAEAHGNLGAALRDL